VCVARQFHLPVQFYVVYCNGFSPCTILRLILPRFS
jgi:hypothetical protein